MILKGMVFTHVMGDDPMRATRIEHHVPSEVTTDFLYMGYFAQKDHPEIEQKPGDFGPKALQEQIEWEYFNSLCRHRKMVFLEDDLVPALKEAFESKDDIVVRQIIEILESRVQMKSYLTDEGVRPEA